MNNFLACGDTATASPCITLTRKQFIQHQIWLTRSVLCCTGSRRGHCCGEGCGCEGKGAGSGGQRKGLSQGAGRDASEAERC